jgi:hypothetical protein
MVKNFKIIEEHDYSLSFLNFFNFVPIATLNALSAAICASTHLQLPYQLDAHLSSGSGGIISHSAYLHIRVGHSNE